jgi:hypothetical protein
MSLKLKVLGLGLLAVMATSAFAAMNASAVTKGHFVADPPDHTLKIKGTESFPGNHNLTFQRTVNGVASGSPIKCTHAEYHGELTGAEATTSEKIKVTPVYKNCATEGGVWGEVKVHHPETDACKTNVYEFTSGNPGTIHIRCTVTVTHPNCTMRIPEQTLSGATYNTVVENNKHAITLGINVQGITGHFEGGACIFLGTSQIFHMTGSVTVWGENSAGSRVNVTYTD